MMTHHHFLVMTFDLVRISGLNQSGQVSKNSNTFSFESRVKDMSKIDEICNICVVLYQVPTVVMIGTILLFLNL